MKHSKRSIFTSFEKWAQVWKQCLQQKRWRKPPVLCSFGKPRSCVQFGFELKFFKSCESAKLLIYHSPVWACTWVFAFCEKDAALMGCACWTEVPLPQHCSAMVVSEVVASIVFKIHEAWYSCQGKQDQNQSVNEATVHGGSQLVDKSCKTRENQSIAVRALECLEQRHTWNVFEGKLLSEKKALSLQWCAPTGPS